MKRLPEFPWPKYVLLWTGFAGVFALSTITVAPENADSTWTYPAMAATVFFMAAALCKAAFIVAWQFPLERKHLPIQLAAYAFFTVATGWGIERYFAWLEGLIAAPGSAWQSPLAIPKLPYIIIANMLVAGTAVRFANRYHNQGIALLRIEHEIATAHMSAAELELDPADVLPALERIESLIGKDRDTALEEIASLGDRMRLRIRKR